VKDIKQFDEAELKSAFSHLPYKISVVRKPG